MMQSIVHFLRELEYKLQNHVVPLFMILDNEYLMDWEIKTKQLWAAHSHNEDHYDAKWNWNHIYVFYFTEKECCVRVELNFIKLDIFVWIVPQIVSDVIITGWDTNMKT